LRLPRRTGIDLLCLPSPCECHGGGAVLLAISDPIHAIVAATPVPLPKPDPSPKMRLAGRHLARAGLRRHRTGGADEIPSMPAHGRPLCPPAPEWLAHIRNGESAVVAKAKYVTMEYQKYAISRLHRVMIGRAPSSART